MGHKIYLIMPQCIVITTHRSDTNQDFNPQDYPYPNLLAKHLALRFANTLLKPFEPLKNENLKGYGYFYPKDRANWD